MFSSLQRAAEAVKAHSAQVLGTLGVVSTGDVAPASDELGSERYAFITDQLLAVAFQTEQQIAAISARLRHQHGGRFMVWNLSEDSYDYGAFEQQVVEVRCPGQPSLPLGLLFNTVLLMENWLAADVANVAVVHCRTGRGRTNTLLVCYLLWSGTCSSVDEAMLAVQERRGGQRGATQERPISQLMVPSQHRYCLAFERALAFDEPPSPLPLLLRRVIVHGVPRFARRETRSPAPAPSAAELDDLFDAEPVDGSGIAGGPRSGGSAEQQVVCTEGCRPYLQIFRGAKLVFSSAWQDGAVVGAAAEEARWVDCDDGSFSFRADVVVHGDITVRCRHVVGSSVQGVGRKTCSMFRSGFNTGWLGETSSAADGSQFLRLRRHEVDGACEDERFPRDFAVELLFSPIHIEGLEGGCGVVPAPPAAEGACESSGPALQITGDGCQTFIGMIEREKQFWRDIRQRHSRRVAAASSQQPPTLRIPATPTRSQASGPAAPARASGGASARSPARSPTPQDVVDEFGSFSLSLDLDSPSGGSAAATPPAAPAAARRRQPQTPTAAAHTPTTADDATDDFDAFADIERELGLDTLPADLRVDLASMAKSGSDATSPVDFGLDDDEFELNLEEWLNKEQQDG